MTHSVRKISFKKGVLLGVSIPGWTSPWWMETSSVRTEFFFEVFSLRSENKKSLNRFG